MALTERLQIIVTADGKGAAQEFQKIGATAERELGRTDDKVKRLSSGLVSSGTQIALAGGIATAGVFALAKAAGDYEEAASAAGVIFGEASESVEEFGKNAIDAAGLSRRAAVEAANTFGTFGKAAGLTGEDLASFSTELTQLAGDLASFKNTSTEDAITAIGAALRGESEPIRRYGVLLDDATLKQEALSLGIYDGNGALSQQQKVLAAQASIFKQTSDAQGDFQRTSESLSNQTRSFTAEIENLKVGLGEGAVPVFSELVGAANSALSSFQDLSPETQTLVGRIGAIAAIGTTAVGGLSVLAGGALRAVDTFRDMGSRARDAEGNLTTLGKTGAVVGGALGAAGLAFTVYQLGKAFNESTKDVVGFDTALNNLKNASPGTVEFDRSIADGAKDASGAVDDLNDALFRITRGSTPATVAIGDFNVQIDDLDRYLASLFEKDPAELERVLDRLANIEPPTAPGLDDDQAWNNLQDSINEYRENIASANATGKTGFEQFRGGIDVYRQSVDEAAASVDSFTGSLDLTNKTVKLSGDLFDLASGRADAFLGSLESSTGMDDMLESVLGLTEGLMDLRTNVQNLDETVDISDIADGITAPAEDTIGVLRDWIAVGDEAQQVIADVFEFRGAEEATRRADQIRTQFVGIMNQAGYTDEQIVELLGTMGLLPEQVNTAITISGNDEAIAKLTLLRDFYLNEDGSSGIPAEVETQVSVAIAEGRFVDAANLISIWVQDQEDGSIENPLLIALGLGDTQPASDEVDGWKRDEEAKPPAEVPVGADTSQARSDAAELFFDIERLAPIIKVGITYNADAANAAGAAAVRGISRITGGVPTFDSSFDNKPRRAAGGPVAAGMPFWANEPSLGGELFVPKTDGFVMKASDTDRLISGLESLLSGQGGNGVTVNQQIVTADPVVAGSESARKMRDAQFLAGV